MLAATPRFLFLQLGEWHSFEKARGHEHCTLERDGSKVQCSLFSRIQFDLPMSWGSLFLISLFSYTESFSVAGTMSYFSLCAQHTVQDWQGFGVRVATQQTAGIKSLQCGIPEIGIR